jgi:hypothetical protein
MKHPSLFTLLFVSSAVVIAGCGGESGVKAAAPQAAASVAPTAQKAAPRGTAPAKAAPPKQEEPPALTVPEGYRYDPRGRRDPFLNPIPKPVTVGQEAPVVRPDGMRGMLVGETKITGIVTSRQPGMTKAILTSGRQTYFAVQGDALFDGVIKEIRSDGVVFTMISPVTKEPINRETLVPTGNRATTTGDKK